MLDPYEQKKKKKKKDTTNIQVKLPSRKHHGPKNVPGLVSPPPQMSFFSLPKPILQSPLNKTGAQA
jgi:hypothetical protein